MNIYVGNLSWDMTEEDLQNLFTPYGEVASAKIVTDKFNNNRSKGFGFVEMANDEEANAAITALHETDVMGRNLVVNQAQERPPREGGGGGGGFKKRSFGGGSGGGGGFRKGGGGGGFNRGGSGGGGGFNRDRGFGGGDRGGFNKDY